MNLACIILTSLLAINCQAKPIEWERSTLTLVAEGGTYARIIRLDSAHLVCCFQRGGESWITRSRDDGKTWGEEMEVTSYPHGTAANPELLRLRNGDLWLLYNERPDNDKHPYSISRAISHDQGLTWDDSVRVFTAGHDRRTGCWEPIAIEFPDSEVQIHFANEFPYQESKEQEISMISSTDPKKVWTVSFRKNARDGMPVPILLNDKRTLVMAIEDSAIEGKIKPVILRSDITQRWKEGHINAQSPRRERALAQPLPAEVYAGAPYLRQMPHGTTVLSVQSDEGRAKPQMVVYTGDAMARRSENGSVPFLLKSDDGGYWNSLFVKNDETITAVSATRIKGRSGVWTIDGKVPPPHR